MGRGRLGPLRSPSDLTEARALGCTLRMQTHTDLRFPQDSELRQCGQTPKRQAEGAEPPPSGDSFNRRQVDEELHQARIPSCQVLGSAEAPRSDPLVVP